MGEILKAIKIECWWQAVLLIGVALCAATLLVDISFVNPKFLFTFGFGCVFIGIGFWISKRYRFINAPEGIYQWPAYEHNKITKTIITIGLIIITVSFILILYSLFKDDVIELFK